jgi:UDPglucose 6-dehydrogenase
MKKIAMIGCGKLGLPCAEVMSEKYDVIGYDIIIPENSNIRVTDNLENAIKDSDFIFIAVPTPHEKGYDGSNPISDKRPKNFDYSIVKDILLQVNTCVTESQLVVLISTVLPGTTRKYLAPLITNARFIYNPYLIAMGSVKWDMVNPECLIIGTEDGSITGDAKELIEFYKTLMQNNPTINVGTWDEAEAIKIFYNTFISAKIGLVNMIQDVAEKNGNINVDIVTDALKNATHRITGPRYLTAGMGDGGACHPRDNIALRWLAQELDLGYDLFHAIMQSRDIQAKNKANKLFELQKETGKIIVIHGRAYKPYVPYTDGSYSDLISYYLSELGANFEFVDPLTNDGRSTDSPAIFFMAHNPTVTYNGTGVAIKEDMFYCSIPANSIIVDPWRTIPKMPDITVLHYGNTRNI